MMLSSTRIIMLFLSLAPLFVRNGFMVGQKSVLLAPAEHLSLKYVFMASRLMLTVRFRCKRYCASDTVPNLLPLVFSCIC